MKLIPQLCLFALALVAGCAPTGYNSTVNAFHDDAYAGGKTYCIFPGSRNVTPEDMEFREYAALVDQALAPKGYTRTQDKRTADIAVFMVFGISDNRDVASSYAVTTFEQAWQPNAPAQAAPEYAPADPVRGVTAHNRIVDRGATYYRALILEAYDYNALRKDRQMRQIWRITVGSSGSSPDLREVFPKMTAAMEDYVDTNASAFVSVDDFGHKTAGK